MICQISSSWHVQNPPTNTPKYIQLVNKNNKSMTKPYENEPRTWPWICKSLLVLFTTHPQNSMNSKCPASRVDPTQVSKTPELSCVYWQHGDGLACRVDAYGMPAMAPYPNTGLLWKHTKRKSFKHPPPTSFSPKRFRSWFQSSL